MKQIKFVMINEFMPVLFSSAISHDAFKPLGKITSAGFVHWDGNIVETYGDSFSLKIGPTEHDAGLIKKMLDAGGMP